MSKIPILFLVYNRLDCTKKSLNSILKYEPNKIYISCDGPKNNPLDKKKTNQVRRYIEKKTMKIKKVQFLFNKKNLGCKKSNLKALNWFFKKEKKGVILEDDCVANQNFFSFCKSLLFKYKKNKKIYCISGSNFQSQPIDKNSYYFSKYNHCWGWATWSDRWRYNDGNIKFWPKLKENKNWKKLHRNNLERQYWEKIFDKVYKNRVDSWAYPWTLSVWKKNGLTITPNSNLVKNIGFGENSTHSKFKLDKITYKNKSKINDILLHPKQIKANNTADNLVFKNHFKGIEQLWPYKFFYLIKILYIATFSFFRKLID